MKRNGQVAKFRFFFMEVSNPPQGFLCLRVNINAALLTVICQVERVLPHVAAV